MRAHELNADIRESQKRIAKVELAKRLIEPATGSVYDAIADHICCEIADRVPYEYKALDERIRQVGLAKKLPSGNLLDNPSLSFYSWGGLFEIKDEVKLEETDFPTDRDWRAVYDWMMNTSVDAHCDAESLTKAYLTWWFNMRIDISPQVAFKMFAKLDDMSEVMEYNHLVRLAHSGKRYAVDYEIKRSVSMPKEYVELLVATGKIKQNTHSYTTAVCGL